MSWLSGTEIRGALRKELAAEWRSKHGWLTASLFGLSSVFAMSLATFGDRPSPTVAAGMLSVVTLFSGALSLPRLFLAEDDQRTLDLLRLVANPVPSFFGKAIAALVQAVVTSLATLLLFVVLTGLPVPHPVWATASVLLFSISVTGAMSLAGAIVLGAANRWVLAAAIALPLIMPLIFLNTGALRIAFGFGDPVRLPSFAIGLVGAGLAWWALAPVIVDPLWGRSKSGAPTSDSHKLGNG